MSKEVKELLDRLDIVPQSRDRCLCLSAKTLPIKASPSPPKKRGCSLTGCYLGIYKRTDEGVCPYFVVLLRHEVDCDWKQREAFLDAKRASLHIKETPSSKRRGRFFVFNPAVSANEALPRYTPTNHPLTCFR